MSSLLVKSARDTFIALVFLLATACQTGTQLMPTPAVLVNAIMAPVTAISPKFQSNKVDVLYATDRNQVAGKPGELHYGANRSRSLAFGQCTVEIGKNVGWKSLVELSTTARRSLTLPLTVGNVIEVGRFPATPYPLVETPEGLKPDPEYLEKDECIRHSFQEKLSDMLALTRRKEVFLLIHGYNNSFEDAVFTIAQFWQFMGREGVPIAYTWPAGIGGLRGYTYDRESGEFTNYHLKQFLIMLSENPDLQKIYIISHSRGTDVCTTALRELFAEARGAGKTPQSIYKIGNLILAAPDLDSDVVTQRVSAERLQLGVDRLTIYTSAFDRALGLSGWLFQGVKRLGKLGLTDLTNQEREGLKRNKGVNVINVTSHSGFLGHGYFYSNPCVSADLILLLRDTRAPGEENGRPLKPLAPGFWELYAGYPNKKSL